VEGLIPAARDRAERRARRQAARRTGGIWHAEWAWLPDRGMVADVLLEADAAGRLTRVESGAPRPDRATRLRGVTIPGLANAHSHAFHRALRGRVHRGAGDFWVWREQMYALARRLDPERYHQLARACFAEMALAGITLVGEFHYLHHSASGRPYRTPNVMAEALRQAAADAGVRLTLLDTLYLRSGFEGRPLDPVQRRFSDGDVERWEQRVDDLTGAWSTAAQARVGAAIHSVRAVDRTSIKLAAAHARAGDLPLHIHLSEQLAENEACLGAHGCTPTELLVEAGALGEWATAVHATHVTGSDLDLLAAAGTGVCLCPTTERDLADGIGPARAMADRRIALSLGSDSHAVIDLFEEARAVELHERLLSGTRGGLRPESLLATATEHGAAALGWPEAGVLAAGRLADFVTIGLDSVRLAGTRPPNLAPAVVFAAAAADVTDVVVGGRPVVREGRHWLIEDVPAALGEAMAGVIPSSRGGRGARGPQ
jgi:formiminoglutamate deiminase